ncbi:MAG: ZIP family metal transporter [Candidatus Moranbacteria bacterium]|nr:ZIP family metal transporter [Candidatus Moranbacteria bacterium]
MITVYVYTFVGVLVVSVISLVGVFIFSSREDILRKYIFICISLAVGALLGDAFIHLIPEALEKSSDTTATGVFIILGILSFFTLEKVLHWHHHGEDAKENHIHPVGRLILFSDGVHNFLDGTIIAASFMVSVPVGVATTLAVILHEIPQEVGDFAILLHSGYSRRRALVLNFLSALTAFVGAVAFFAFGELSKSLVDYFIPLAAGGFIYIAASDLIPELHKTKQARHSLYQLVAVLLGVLAMVALAFLN